MKRYHFHIARIVLCIVAIAIVDNNNIHLAVKWIVMAPWITLCFFGIACTMPILLLVYGMGAMGQGDWSGPVLDAILFLITPTIIAIIISELVACFIRGDKRSDQQTNH